MENKAGEALGTQATCMQKSHVEGRAEHASHMHAKEPRRGESGESKESSDKEKTKKGRRQRTGRRRKTDRRKTCVFWCRCSFQSIVKRTCSAVPVHARVPREAKRRVARPALCENVSPSCRLLLPLQPPWQSAPPAVSTAAF